MIYAFRFPVKMLVDYIRVYQPANQEPRIGCDPPDMPTSRYIAAHAAAYNNPNLTTWAQHGEVFPPNSFLVSLQAFLSDEIIDSFAQLVCAPGPMLEDRCGSVNGLKVWLSSFIRHKDILYSSFLRSLVLSMLCLVRT